MIEHTDTSDPVGGCSCGETHNGHVCWLVRKGLHHAVQHLKLNPTTVCSLCGAWSAMPQNVCYPELIIR
jgi:hypothetical protein